MKTYPIRYSPEALNDLDEELNSLKDENLTLSKKLSGLNEDELEQIAGGIGGSATLDVVREVAQSIFDGKSVTEGKRPLLPSKGDPLGGALIPSGDTD